MYSSQHHLHMRRSRLFRFKQGIIKVFFSELASLPACSLGKRRIKKQWIASPRLHAGSDAYPGWRHTVLTAKDFYWKHRLPCGTEAPLGRREGASHRRRGCQSVSGRNVSRAMDTEGACVARTPEGI